MHAALLLLTMLVSLATLFAAVALLRGRRDAGAALARLAQRVSDGERAQERVERAVREEVARSREELAAAGRAQRQELAETLRGFGDALTLRVSDLAQTSERRLEALRGTLEERLRTLQQDNARQIEQMRQTVDEKLQSTLERRLGESFRQVSERLEQVHKGLGEMQTLATGVGDLKKVLSNVKTRGTWGEVQLGALLEQVLTPDQFVANATPKDGGEHVEFAIKLPGQGGDTVAPVLLPIDAKFPIEDYQRLLEAQERADAAAIEATGRQLERRVRDCAAEIARKYLNPPRTTDFGILFLPIEGLFAEVIRRAGLTETLQREQRVVLAGPTTLWSILNSLQMGFRTLAIRQRSSEVWSLLGAVKTEWGRYGECIDAVQKRLQQAAETLDKVRVRSRAVGRKLRDVQELPADTTATLLGAGEEEAESPRGAAPLELDLETEPA